MVHCNMVWCTATILGSYCNFGGHRGHRRIPALDHTVIGDPRESTGVTEGSPGSRGWTW